MTLMETNTVLTVASGSFDLKTSYSGTPNPNVTYTITFTVRDSASLALLENAEITVDGDINYTNVSGVSVIELVRDDYAAIISKTGYETQTYNFSIVDTNLTHTIDLVNVGSFDDSFDDSFEN